MVTAGSSRTRDPSCKYLWHLRVVIVDMNTRIWIVLAMVAAVVTLALAQVVKAKPGETLMVMQVAGKGQIVVRLETAKAPQTTAHISGLVERGFYNNQKFFKVEKEPRPYLVRFGDPGTKTRPVTDPSIGSGGSGARIPFENTGLPNEAGAVGLSTRQGDPGSGDSQFYMLLAPARFLDGSYAVFGTVVQGMEVLQKVELGDQVTSVRLVRG